MPASSASAAGLAGRYATALFDLARDQKALDAVGADLQSVKRMLAESADLRRLVRSPVVSREDQAAALDALADRAGFYGLTRKFLSFLAQKRRLFALPEIIEAYAAMLAVHKGEVAAEVVSAVPLTDEQLTALKEQLSRAVGHKVNVVAAVDPDLLGGLVVRVGSRMIDGSLRTKLHQLEIAMRGAA